MSRHLPIRVASGLAVIAYCAGSGLLQASEPARPENAIQLVADVQEAESRRDSDVRKIVSTRRYVLKNDRWEKDAVMQVRITWESGVGKQFEILSMENAEGLQKRVFHKLIEGEKEASRNDWQMSDTDITAENYSFDLIGTDRVLGRDCLVLKLKPKRNNKYLLEGKAWVDPKERAIIKVEGRTARSVSFWIGKPYIAQEFRKVGDMWMSAVNRSTSDVKLLGKTELCVQFLDYDIKRSGGSAIAHNTPK